MKKLMLLMLCISTFSVWANTQIKITKSLPQGLIIELSEFLNSENEGTKTFGDLEVTTKMPGTFVYGGSKTAILKATEEIGKVSISVETSIAGDNLEKLAENLEKQAPFMQKMGETTIACKKSYAIGAGFLSCTIAMTNNL